MTRNQWLASIGIAVLSELLVAVAASYAGFIEVFFWHEEHGVPIVRDVFFILGGVTLAFVVPVIARVGGIAWAGGTPVKRAARAALALVLIASSVPIAFAGVIRPWRIDLGGAIFLAGVIRCCTLSLASWIGFGRPSTRGVVVLLPATSLAPFAALVLSILSGLLWLTVLPIVAGGSVLGMLSWSASGRRTSGCTGARASGLIDSFQFTRAGPVNLAFGITRNSTLLAFAPE